MGNADGQINYGDMFVEGAGGPQDFNLALEWCAKAEKTGQKDAGARILKTQMQQLQSEGAAKTGLK